LDEASRTKNKKIAWCSSVGPAELAMSLGFLVYYPENHAAMLGSTRTAMDYIPVANAHGYSPEICSYLTSDIGAYLRHETPLTKAYGIKEVPGRMCCSTTPTSAAMSVRLGAFLRP
jgi:benzoyl-CoA reductase/2-hydroxyglutaryl-CoA dehydratase subunit BcrC/BadD/HgdB